MSSPLAMLDILMLPTLMPLDTHMVLLPTLTELLSLLMSQLSMLARLLTLLPVVSSTPSEFTVMPTDMLDSLPPPTVLLSQLSPMRLLLPVLPILLPLLPHKNHLVCRLYLLERKSNMICEFCSNLIETLPNFA